MSHKCLCLQGDINPIRRNYTGLLTDVAAAADLVEHPDFELQILARGTLDEAIIPDSLKGKLVQKHLQYPVMLLVQFVNINNVHKLLSTAPIIVSSMGYRSTIRRCMMP